MNHTSDQHQWFLASRASRSNPYRDWYVWHDGKGETATSSGEPPNNWESLFGHSAWQWDELTRQYYYHKFYIQQPDLNWNNVAVHQAFKDILSFWLQRGVGGFRFDAITELLEDPDFQDEPVMKDASGNPLLNAFGDPVVDQSKTRNLPGLHAIVHEMRAHIDTFDSDLFPGTRVMIGETYLRNVGELETMYGTKAAPEFELPMDTQVGFLNKLDVAAFRQRLDDAEERIGSNTPLLVFDNHDNPRLDVRYGDGEHDTAIQRAIATVLFMSRGAALFYYGDEIGMKTTPPTRKEDVKDPIGTTGWPKEKGRDGERTPMQWDGTSQAGFTRGRPWLPVPPTANVVNVKTEESNPDSLLAWYRALIRLKRNSAVLEGGETRMLDISNAKVLSWARQLRGETVVVCVNFTGKPQVVNLATELKHEAVQTLLQSPGGTNPTSLASIPLAPFGEYIGTYK
jgi:alpha-glucosidase